MTPPRPRDDVQRALGLYRAGRPEDAAKLARQAARRAPSDAAAWSVLAASLKALGRLGQALQAAESAVAAAPQSIDNRANLALVQAESGRLRKAAETYRTAIARAPERADLYHGLGQVLLALDDPRRACEAFQSAIGRSPEDAGAHFGLGNALAALGLPGSAAESYETAARLHPNWADAHGNLGNALQQLGRSEEAESACRRAVELAPERAPAHNNLGAVLRALGRLDEAAACFRRAAELDPRSGEPLSNLATAKTFAAEDPDIALLEQRWARGDLPEEALVHLHYALGKAYADLGDRPRAAFARFAEGARRKRARIDYDIGRDETRISALARTPAPAGLTASALPEGAPAPLFILGMPRAGTTLVEQILASHSRIAAGGEQLALSRAVEAVRRDGGESVPQLAGQLDPERLAEIARLYHRHRLVEAASGSAFVTDKMPANFALLKVIRAAFPEACVVHVRRDPLDTCVSAFSRLFAGEAQAFSYDLAELGRYYAAYADFMARCTPPAPAAGFVELHYEQLVADPQSEVARLLEACGLGWQDACLEFHRSGRSVRTASASQVRQPLYATSIGAWRAYADALAPLRRVLEEAGVIDAEGRPLDGPRSLDAAPGGG